VSLGFSKHNLFSPYTRNTFPDRHIYVAQLRASFQKLRFSFTGSYFLQEHVDRNLSAFSRGYPSKYPDPLKSLQVTSQPSLFILVQQVLPSPQSSWNTEVYIIIFS
jgi:hypothetical protein